MIQNVHKHESLLIHIINTDAPWPWNCDWACDDGYTKSWNRCIEQPKNNYTIEYFYRNNSYAGVPSKAFLLAVVDDQGDVIKRTNDSLTLRIKQNAPGGDIDKLFSELSEWRYINGWYGNTSPTQEYYYKYIPDTSFYVTWELKFYCNYSETETCTIGNNTYTIKKCPSWWRWCKSRVYQDYTYN